MIIVIAVAITIINIATIIINNNSAFLIKC